MKQICTLIAFALVFLQTKAQVVLNEIYSIPGSDRHEFFELFNNAPSSAPESMDNYTLVTYFEESGSVKGFYVLDLPALSVASKGYFVGAAAEPFNFQGITNCTAADFSWNNVAYLTAHNGYLKKWILATSVPASIDDNSDYDEEVLPANFNDLFSKVSGGKATYNAFLYKNGVLLNAFFGGVGGASTVPTYITAMPVLQVNMAGAAPDFSINFPNYSTVKAEFTTPEAGTDNGYIRARDGFCSSWTKSSNQINHTPGLYNGDGAVPDGEISVSAATAGGTSATGSTVNYDVVGAPVSSFPITMHVYTDLGTKAMLLDSSDTYVASSTEITLSDGPFSTVFQPHWSNVLIVTISSAGCIDNLRFIPISGVLPVAMQHVNVSLQGEKPVVQWAVTENESVQQFEVESGNTPDRLSTAAVVMTSATTGTAQYKFKDSETDVQVRYYRIKMIDKQQRITYSNVMRIGGTNSSLAQIKMMENPVRHQLSVELISSTAETKSLSVYNMAGVRVTSWIIPCEQGVHRKVLPLQNTLAPGTYVLECAGKRERTTTKFIKQ